MIQISYEEQVMLRLFFFPSVLPHECQDSISKEVVTTPFPILFNLPYIYNSAILLDVV